ncbi:MAG: hypothetical protein ABI618_08765 [Nitrospirota bacterium]
MRGFEVNEWVVYSLTVSFPWIVAEMQDGRPAAATLTSVPNTPAMSLFRNLSVAARKSYYPRPRQSALGDQEPDVPDFLPSRSVDRMRSAAHMGQTFVVRYQPKE